jgi:hypothetical protein
MPPTLRALARVAAAALIAGSALLVLGAPGEALAQAADAKGERVVVLWVEGGGKKDGDVRQAIEAKIPSGVRVVDDAAFRKAMIKAGQKLPYGRVLAKGPFRKAALDRTRKALAELKAEGAILGLIRIGKGGQEVVLLYVETRDTGEEPDVDVPILLKGDVGAPVGEALSSQIAAWSGGAPAPAEPPPKEAEPTKEPQPEEKEPEEEEEPEEPEDDGEGRPANQYGREIFSIAAAFDLSGRWFSYNDGITSNLRDYDVFGAPGFQVGAEVYPLAGTDVPVMKDLGLTGRFGMALGLSSETEGGAAVTTSWTRFDVGMRLRVRTGSEEAPVLGLHGGFGIDTFELEAEGALGDEVPSASYKFLRVGVDGRIPLGPVAINLFFDYLGAVSAGTVYDRFTGSSIGGIATGGGFIVPIASGFEVRLGAEYERWFYAFEPVVGDAFVAGGALDERIHLTLGPAYVF